MADILDHRTLRRLDAERARASAEPEMAEQRPAPARRRTVHVTPKRASGPDHDEIMAQRRAWLQAKAEMERRMEERGKVAPGFLGARWPLLR